MKNIAKQKASQILAAKGSDLISEQLLNITKKQGNKGAKRFFGRKKQTELISNREKFLKKDFKSLIAKKLHNNL